MTMRSFIHAAAICVVAVFLMAASANATVIFNTTTGTQFVSTGTLTLGSLVVPGSATATLLFAPQLGASVNPPPPSNVNYGIFTLACPLCTANNNGSPVGATFAPFDFNLVVTETSPAAASGTFVGHSAGGIVYLNQSTITLTWLPIQLGPGGSFGTTSFTIESPTGIVNPTSGTNDGQTTVQGAVSTAIPEPATLGLIGGGLIGLGLLRRKRSPRS